MFLVALRSTLFILLGYFGNTRVQEHFELLIVGIVLVSLSLPL